MTSTEIFEKLNLTQSSPSFKDKFILQFNERVLEKIMNLVLDQLSPEEIKELMAVVDTQSDADFDNYLAQKIPEIGVIVEQAKQEVLADLAMFAKKEEE